MRGALTRYQPELAEEVGEGDSTERFSSCLCLADLQYADGLGELASAPATAAELTQDALGLALGVRALAR
jgi:hypothetical protein